MSWIACANRWLFAMVLVPALPSLVVAADPEGKAEPPKFEPAQIEFFEAKVRPILVQRCYECHGPELKEPKGGLRVSSREAILKGGDTGPAATPGKPKDSLLIESINYTGLYEMPPKTRLPAAEVETLTKWVEMGLPWPKEAAAGAVAKGFDLEARKKAHWAWNPIPYQLPAIKNAAAAKTDIDRFLLAKLEEKGLGLAPAAAKETLLRRVTFDLTGLPPTTAELDAFLADSAPNAFEKVIDRLLQSPRYGERWARHWLDLVRYAESRGHEFDYNIPNAWQYRDYVVRAINADVPYDTFAKEHLAGDLMPQPRINAEKGFNESILGTGFWFLGEWVHSPVDIRQDECDRQDNMIDVMSKTFLGLTVSCARCHDHKFDAISQADYYALAGYMQSSAYRLARFETMEQDKELAKHLQTMRESQQLSLLRLYGAALKDRMRNADVYLRTAYEVVQKGAAAGDKELSATRVAAAAEEKAIDVALLKGWAQALFAAKGDPTDPLHALAIVAFDPAMKDGKPLQEKTKALVAGWREEVARFEKGMSGATVVVDYSANEFPTNAWLADGQTFGPAPVRRGDIRLGGPADQPTWNVARVSAAQRDPFWNGLQLSPGAEHDWGATTNVIRSGRTLRTPTFTVKEGPVWVWATGEGHSTAVVCSHHMTAGPLHGGLSQRFRHEAGTWRWVRHDLTRYIGQRVHLEFTAEGDQDLAIRLVAQSKNAPPEPLLPKSESIAKCLEPGIDSFQELVNQTAGRIKDEANLLLPPLTGDSDPALLTWLLRQRAWLVHSGSEEGARLEATEVALRARELELRKKVQPSSRLAMAMWEGDAVDEQLLIRGNSRTPAAPVAARLPQAIFGAEQASEKTASRRAIMADRLIDPKLNPFFARVQVNRIWHHLFGRGIVSTVDNFGVLGEAPTHPELLQYLADQFARDGFSQKRFIKSILLSAAYQMSSVADAKGMEVDPKNELLHHMRIRRLQSEAIRDSLLALSGRLVESPGGPPTPVYLTEFMQGRGRPGGGPLDGAGKRSLYISVRRNFLSPMMLAFDTPIPFTTVGRRNLSNVPAQALILMNDPFVLDQAKRWGGQTAGQKLPAEDRVRQMYRAAFARLPSDAEIAAAVAFLVQQTKEYGMPGEQMLTDPRPWSDLGHVLINSKEFIFIP